MTSLLTCYSGTDSRVPGPLVPTADDPGEPSPDLDDQTKSFHGALKMFSLDTKHFEYWYISNIFDVLKPAIHINCSVGSIRLQWMDTTSVSEPD